MNLVSLYLPFPPTHPLDPKQKIEKQKASNNETDLKIIIEKLRRSLQVQYKKNLLLFEPSKQNPESQETVSSSNRESNSKRPFEHLQQNSTKFSLMCPIQKGYQVLIECEINLNHSRIILISTLLRNARIVNVESKSSAIILSKYLCAKNAHIKEGSFHIQYPCLSVHHVSNLIFSSDRLLYYLQNPTKFQSRIFDPKIKPIEKLWNMYLNDYYQFCDKKSLDQAHSRFISTAYSKQIKNVSKLIKRSHIQSSQLSHYQGYNKSITKQQKDYNSHKSKNNEDKMLKDIKQLQSGIRELLEMYGGGKNVQQLIQSSRKQVIGQPFQEAEKKSMLNDLNCSTFNGKFKLYSQIQISSVRSNQRIHSTIFSDLQHMNVLAKRQNDQDFKNISLVHKLSKKQNQYNNQVQILKIIKNEKCIFIPRFFFCQQKQYESSVLLQYIPDGSISTYFGGRSFCISPNSKLYILYQVTIALRFLKDFSIVHKDLKPGNLLIKLCQSSKFVYYLVKLIDFGQSYCNSIKPKSLGNTIPYASPEDVNLRRLGGKIDQKSDVFSFGIMLFELIFQVFPLQPLRLGKSLYRQDQNQQGSYPYLNFYSLPFERLESEGTTQVVRLLQYLCLKCISPNPQQRPTLNWLQLIIKKIYMLYQKCIE